MSCLQSAMRSAGVRIVDLTNVTHAYAEGAYDGLHYLSTYQERHNGRVSNMMLQVCLNVLFPHCSGSGDSSGDSSGSVRSGAG